MRVYSLVLSVSIIFSMVACGSGGGSGTGSGAGFSGSVVDDLVLDGIVVATDANDPSNILATGRTSSVDGTYELNITAGFIGVAVITATCDSNSTLFNPDTNVTSACPDGFSMRSAISVTGNGAITVNITPLTEAIHQQMTDSGGNVTEEDFNDARFNIGLMFGVDPLGGDPLTGDYASIIGAFAKIANDVNQTTIDIIRQFASDVADGTAGDDNISSLLAQAMADNNISNFLTDNNGSYTPPANPFGNLDDVDISSAIFQELRSQLLNLTDFNNSGTPGFFDLDHQGIQNSLESVGGDLGLALNLTGIISQGVIKIEESNLSQISDSYMDKNITITKNMDGNFSYVVNDSSRNWNGNISIPVLMGIPGINSFVQFDFNIDGQLPPDEFNASNLQHQDVAFNLSLIVNIDNNGSVSLFDINDSFVLDENASADLSIDGNLTTSNTSFLGLGGIDLNVDYFFNPDTNLTSGQLIFLNAPGIMMTADIPGYNINGSLGVEYLTNNTFTDNNGMVPGSIHFDGSIFDTVSSTLLEGNVSIGVLNITDLNLSDIGNINENDLVPFIDISGLLDLPLSPATIIDIYAVSHSDTNRTLTFSYRHDAVVITINVQETGNTLIFNVTAPNGFSASWTFVDGELDLSSLNEVRIDGNVIGHLEERFGVPVIVYIDGSFESLP